MGGKVAAVFFKDGAKVHKGELLMHFDTRQAADEQRTLKQLIGLEELGRLPAPATAGAGRSGL